MKELFSRLEGLSARINQASDSLSTTLAQIEVKLRDLRLGVEAWVPTETTQFCDDVGNDDGAMLEFLGYGKYNGQWQLLIKNQTEDPDEDGTPTRNESPPVPLCQQPRETRVKAIQHLPALLEALAKNAENTLQMIESQKAVAQAVIDELGLKKRPH
ncbi:MAG: hypothetical protein HY284_06060 [Nitrospirae bacterium]|nr:hypothetical protein [Nitrospirota bacterium]